MPVPLTLLCAQRVVFLSQLPSGLLLVTGPFKVNGVPLRRVNQAYVIATSKKVDVSGVSIPSGLTDDAFSRLEDAAGDDFTDAAAERKGVPQERQDDQQAVDGPVIAGLDAITKKYLKSRFALAKGQYPHQMKF